MRSGIEQARIEQAQWKARVEADQAALDVAEREAAAIRDRLGEVILEQSHYDAVTRGQFGASQLPARAAVNTSFLKRAA